MTESLQSFLLRARRRLVHQWQETLPLAQLRSIAEESRAQMLAPIPFLGEKLPGGEATHIVELCTETELASLIERPTEAKGPLLSILTGPEDGLIALGDPSQPLPRAKYGNQVFLLRNGFFQSEFDVLESAALGYDGICIHAQGLDHYEIQYLTELCRDFRLSLVVWVDSEETVDTALQTDAPYLGINAMHAEDFSDNTIQLTRLAQRIPSTCTRLAWLRQTPDKRTLATAGIRGFVR